MANIWESRNGASFFNLSGHTEPVLSLSLSTMGVLVSASATELFVWNTMTGRPDAIEGGYHSLAAWSPDARYLLTRSAEGVTVLDGDSRTALNTFPVTTDNVLRVKWSPQGGAFALVGEADNAVRVLDAWTGAQRGVYGTDPARALTWSNDGLRLTVWGVEGEMAVWSTFDERIQQTVAGWQADGRTLAWSADSRNIALGTDDGAVLVWDVTTNAPVLDSVLTPADPPTGNISAQIATSEQGNVLTIISAEGAVIGQYPTPFTQSITERGPADIAVNPAGDVLAGAVEFTNAIGEVVYAVVLWDAATGTQLAQLSAHRVPVSALAFSPDGRILATLDVNGGAYLWGVG